MSLLGSPLAGTNPAGSWHSSRTIARSCRCRKPESQDQRLTRRFRTSERGPERLCHAWRPPGEFTRIVTTSAMPGFDIARVACTLARGLLHDAATTASRRPPRYRPRPRRFRRRQDRKIRPADMCKPELSKTSTRASGAYRDPPRRLTPADRRCAARFTPSQRASVRRFRAPSSFFGSSIALAARL